MRPPYAVIFDGTPKGIWGRMIFAQEQTPIAQVDPFAAFTDRGRVTAAVRALKLTLPDWFTIKEIKELVGCSNDHAHNAVNNLQRQGELVRERKQAMRGRRVEQRYRWVK